MPSAHERRPPAGNKCDKDDHEIKPEETEALMDSYPEIFAFIETSAKENRKVDEPFLRLAKVLVVSRPGTGMILVGGQREGGYLYMHVTCLAELCTLGWLSRTYMHSCFQVSNDFTAGPYEMWFHSRLLLSLTTILFVHTFRTTIVPP